MKAKWIGVLSLAVVFALLAGGAVALRAQAPTNPPAPRDQTTMMGGGGGMGMMGMMGQMNAHHEQMSTLMNQLMQSMTAIQNEKDPAALQSKLAEHRALLEKMHSQMMNQGGMMNNFSEQMQQNCPMPKVTPPTAPK
jgi:hypothetical protein